MSNVPLPFQNAQEIKNLKMLDAIEESKWVVVNDSEFTEISNVNGKWKCQTIIQHNFNDIEEVSLRVLGSDSASFGYLTIPTRLWHNSGAYELMAQSFNIAGTFLGYARAYVKNKTVNNFTLEIEATGGFMFAYKLK